MDQQNPSAPGAFTLDGLAFRDDLAGNEGLDANYVSRIRLQYLIGQNATLLGQMQFADAKAAALLTLVGLLSIRGPVDFSTVTAGDFLALASAAFSGLCVLGCVMAIIPRYPPPSIRRAMRVRDRFSWPALASADYDPVDYAMFMRTAEVSQLVMSMAQSNAAVSRILLRKFQLLRLAFMMGIGAFFLMAVRLAAG